MGKYGKIAIPHEDPESVVGDAACYMCSYVNTKRNNTKRIVLHVST